MIVECFVDGSHRPEGTCCAVVIYENRREVFRTVKPVGGTSSVVAEAEAILLAVNICYFNQYSQPTIYSDCKVLCDQFYGLQNVKSKNSLIYLESLWQLSKIYSFKIVNVKRSKVFVPDDMCKSFLLEYQEKYSNDLIN